MKKVLIIIALFFAVMIVLAGSYLLLMKSVLSKITPGETGRF
jgi:hypothetical protein